MYNFDVKVDAHHTRLESFHTANADPESQDTTEFVSHADLLELKRMVDALAEKVI